MSRNLREVPKEIALFGQRQFRETGAAAVEVLRVKASTMRKHFSKLKGITFLVAVISRSRVRVYFFNSMGVMLIGENIEVEKYGKVRKTSKLVAKFEKPRPLTKEELRIEATEELRQDLSRTLKRVSRFLGKKEPEFPIIFITKESSINIGQAFGQRLDEDGALVFEQGILESKWRDGVITRACFLQLLDLEKRNSEFSSAVGNAVALASLSSQKHADWFDIWKRKTRESYFAPIVNHLAMHSTTYSWGGFARILDLVDSAPDLPVDKWMIALDALHESIELSLGTEEHLIIQGFCSSLAKPRTLASRNYRLESIHLSPRVICDPSSLGITLSVGEASKEDESWLKISYIQDAETRHIAITEGDENPISRIMYTLNLEDVFPKSGGILSHGNDILSWILQKFGAKDKRKNTFQAFIEFSNKQVTSAENAILERLLSGSLTVLLDTLVGSPQRVASLVKAGKIIFLPDFHHTGFYPNFLLEGEFDRLVEAVSFSIESTIFHAAKRCYALVSAPSSWNRLILVNSAENDIKVWPIIQTESSRRVIRSESTFPKNSDTLIWSGRNSN